MGAASAMEWVVFDARPGEIESPVDRCQPVDECNFCSTRWRRSGDPRESGVEGSNPCHVHIVRSEYCDVDHKVLGF